MLDCKNVYWTFCFGKKTLFATFQTWTSKLLQQHPDCIEHLRQVQGLQWLWSWLRAADTLCSPSWRIVIEMDISIYGDGDNTKTMWITVKITNDALPITIEITIYQLQITIEISARTSRSPLWRTSGTTLPTSTQPSSFISSLFFIIPSIGGLSKKTHLS